MDKYLFDVSQWKGHKAYVEILPGIYDNHLFKMPKDAFVEVKYVISFNDKWFEPPLISAKWNPQKSLDSKKIKMYLEKRHLRTNRDECHNRIRIKHLQPTLKPTKVNRPLLFQTRITHHRNLIDRRRFLILKPQRQVRTAQFQTNKADFTL